jgi:hypothetical protein
LLFNLLLVLSLLPTSVLAESTEAVPAGSTIAAKAAKPQPIKIVLDGARKSGDCMVEGRAVQQAVQTLRFPAGWTIAIMCTPVRWEQLIQQVNPPRTHAGFTRISERITVLNGAIFHEFPPKYRHILAHELGHIQCGGCNDEGYVEKLAFQLEKGTGPTGSAGAAR